MRQIVHRVFKQSDYTIVNIPALFFVSCSYIYMFISALRQGPRNIEVRVDHENVINENSH